MDQPTFACLQCRQQLDSLVQDAKDTSGEPRQRRVRLIYLQGTRASGPQIGFRQSAWVRPSEPGQSGFSCPSCHQAVELPDELSKRFSDIPASLVEPADFHAATYLDVIRKKVLAEEVAQHDLPSRPASLEDGVRFIDPRMQGALRRLGVVDGKLWSHQIEALAAIESGRHVAIVTSTASGKTMCFNLPVFRSILKDRDARAIYLYPTKALAQDQILKILRFDDDFAEGDAIPQRGSFFRVNLSGSPVTIGKYDGATSDFERDRMRREEHPNILMTNPDMLHFGILRNHQAWEELLGNLRFVVVDEIHTYRGIFGSNVALVLRRLRKLCSHYGADPRFILCSATVGNPLEHARLLSGLRDITLVAKDGSPSKTRTMVLLNPPPLESSPAERAEPVTVAVEVLSKVLLAGKKPAKTIVFGRSRWAVKNAYRILRRRLEEVPSTKDVSKLVREYTATLTPDRREELGFEIASGNVAAVIGTNALELGLDIGDLSAAVIMGYPGSVASLYQKMGRAGRKGEGLGVLILQNNPLEQYYARHPQEFFDRTPEVVLINPSNEPLLAMHLNCALYETQDGGGLSASDLREYFGLDGDRAETLLKSLPNIIRRMEDGKAHFVWQGEKPVYSSIRNPLSKYQFDIMCGTERVGVMDDASVLRDLFPGAVWTDQDRQFIVHKLDFNAHVAEVRDAEPDYYTVAMPNDSVEVLSEDKEAPVGASTFHQGRLKLSRRVRLYKKVPYAGSHKAEVAPIPGAKKLPSLEYETDGVWLTVPVKALEGKTRSPDMGFHALEHGMVSMLPRFVDCDPSDVSGISGVAVSGHPAIFVYDAYSGGVGLSQVFYERAVEILSRVKGLIQSCACSEDSGCPACIQSPQCWAEERPLSKASALAILAVLGV